MKKVDIITALIATMVLAVFLWFATMDIGNNTERLDSMEQKINALESWIEKYHPRIIDEKGNIVND